MKRGTVKSKPKDPAPKQNFIQNKEVFDGNISRRYEGLPKFQIIEPGQRPYIAYSKRSLTELRKKHPTWTINRIKY
ncbi:MAG: hypothetical protein J7619_11945 [Dyadobacter sp.]|uniref:hypothetical protein n=1 Tax=Dyadobacter sp. TaxID=1914288 RepID=UPI001B091DB8|nr:hypothetical protein [Dyadobacter sp.]MBO9613404.1 hypothetical protein [Dyadobacter sp.]